MDGHGGNQGESASSAGIRPPVSRQPPPALGVEVNESAFVTHAPTAAAAVEAVDRQWGVAHGGRLAGANGVGPSKPSPNLLSIDDDHSRRASSVPTT
jgi:hypothetical protein